MRFRHGVALLLTLTTALLSPLDAWAVSLAGTMNFYTDLDNSILDENSAVGTFSYSGDLTLSTGAILNSNDNFAGSVSNSSAKPITLNIGGHFTMDAGSAIFAENRTSGGNGGLISINVGGNFLMAGTSGPTVGASISTNKTAGAGDTGDAGDIAIAVTGSIAIESGAKLLANGPGDGGAISLSAKDINVNGLVETTGTSSIGQGGPISIIAHCDLNVGAAAVIRSKGTDYGADLIHLEACDIVIYGLVESTGKGHAVNIANLVDSANRPDKPANSTAGIEVWAGDSIFIDGLNQNGQLNADLTGGGGTQGISWIDLFAKGDITIFGKTGSSDVFAVHANGGLAANTDEGGLITIKSLEGDVIGSGRILQANATSAGSDGGFILVDAFGDVQFVNAVLQAMGDSVATGGYGDGGLMELQAFNGNLIWTAGIGNVAPTGTGMSNPGDITLTYNGFINLAGTTFPFIGVQNTPLVSQNTNPGAITKPQYVVLPDCEGCGTPPVIAEVPEPATILLGLMGLAAAAMHRRRVA